MIPDNILKALTDETIIKRAFNVNFERVCLSRYLAKNYPAYFQSYSISEDTVGDYLSPVNWHCTMIHSRILGLPSSLAEVGKVLRLEQQKIAKGAKHPYHLIHTDKQSTVYGWVDADLVGKA